MAGSLTRVSGTTASAQAEAPARLENEASSSQDKTKKESGAGATETSATRRQMMIMGTLVVALIVMLICVYWFPTTRPLFALIGASLAAVGVFPLTYFAYLNFREPAQRERLKDDFRLLGLASARDIDDVVARLYDTAYSTTHYIVFISLIIIFCLLIGAAFIFDSQYVGFGGLPWLAYTPGTAVATAADAAAGTSASAATGAAADPRSTLVYLAFLGAYMFGVQELVRRYNTFDLLPQVYSTIFVRLIVATGVVYVGAALIASLFGSDANTAPLALATAFLIGIFPQRGVDWLSERVKNTFDTKMSFSSVRPLTEIIGISPWHQSRLAQMGIDDAQNLAMADMRKLLLTTQFDTEEIVNWVDQAILYVKVGQKIVSLRENYVSTFYELQNCLATANGVESPIATLLSMGDSATLDRIKDTTNYTNYTHIQEYYLRKSSVAQQRAEEGASVIFGTPEPYLAPDVQDLDDEVAPQQEDALQEKIDKLAKLAGNTYKGDAKYWVSLGITKQLLSRKRFETLRLLKSRAAAPDLAQQTQLKQDIRTLQAEARKAFDKAIDLDPTTAQNYVSRADFLLQYPLPLDDRAAKIPQQDVELALRDCTKALECNPAYAMGFNYRAHAYAKLKDYRMALADLNRAIEVDNGLAVGYKNRGTFYTGQSRFAEAVVDFQTAYYCGYRKPVLYASWGQALCGLDQYDAAIEKLSQAIAMNPDLAQAYADRGFANYELGLLDLARADCENAIVKNPNLATPHINLGLIEARLGHHAEAVKCYDKALPLEADKPKDTVYLFRGQSHQALGNEAEAVADLEKALALASSEPAKNEARLPLALAYAQTNTADKSKAVLNDLLNSPAVTEKQRQAAEAMGARMG